MNKCDKCGSEDRVEHIHFEIETTYDYYLCHSCIFRLEEKMNLLMFDFFGGKVAQRQIHQINTVKKTLTKLLEELN